MKPWNSIWRRKKEDSLSSEAETKLLNLLDLSVVGVGSSLAFGLWVLSGHLIKTVAGPAAVASVFLAGVTALVTGFCFAEFGVRFLKSESAYVYCYLNSNQSTAFVFGWTLILQYLAGIASGAKGAIAFIDSLTENQIFDFLNRIAPLDPNGKFPHFDFISLVVIGVIVILILIGMKDSIPVKKLFTICNVILVISVILAGSFKAELKNWYPEGTQDEEVHLNFTPFGLLGVVKGAAIAFYGFLGFDTVSITGNEVKKRKRNIPLAIASTILFTLVAYGGVCAVLTLMMPYDKHDSHAAFPFVFQKSGWMVFKWLVVVATFFSFQTSLFGAAFSLPKTINGMANDGLLFHFLGNSHSKLKTPAAATVTGGLMAALAAGFVSFEELVNIAVIAALFVFSMLATYVVLLRHTSVSSHLSESIPQSLLISPKDATCEISVKSVVRNLFNFTEKFSTNLTKKIVLGNLISFYLSSIGISVIFQYFHEPLIKCTIGAIVPASIFLCILLLNVLSITCQPKCEESAPFKVALFPFLPCLSIFLNIFLMLSFESMTWVFFLSWLAFGIIPYSVWHCVKRCRKKYEENSLYEINKSNAIKLSDSIWKIKFNKKSFYEGAVNPVFFDDEESYVKGNIGVNVIEKAESDKEEKSKPLESKLEVKYAYTEHEEIENNFSGVDNIHWECVAEIHKEVELPVERIALEIVDNTYNFLSEISKDDSNQPSDKDFEISEDSAPSKKEIISERSSNESTKSSPQTPKNPERLLLQEELLNKIKERMKNATNKKNLDETFPEKNVKEIPSQESSEKSSLREIQKDKTIYFEHSNTSDSNNNNNNNNKDTSEFQESVPDEQNKIKQFKEKLNKLLKNQINGRTILSKNLSFSKANVTENDRTLSESNGDTNKNILHNSVKTLNKSQIKGQLEVLLAKGPPKRSTLGSSFNIKMEKTDNEMEFQNSDSDFSDRQKTQSGEPEEQFEDSPFNKAEKIISLKNNELSNDISC